MTKIPPSTPPAAEAELASLKILGKYCKTASGAATAIVSVLPLSGVAVKSLAPVWDAAPYLAVIISFASMFFVFFATRSSSPQSIMRRAVIVTSAGAALLLVYFFLNWMCIFEKDGARVVTGFLPTEEANARVQNGSAKSLHPMDLLASFGYEHADLAWKDARTISAAINFTFCVGCGLVTTGFFLFVMRNVAEDMQKEQNPASHVNAPGPTAPARAPGEHPS
jgi:hypothetical protein